MASSHFALFALVSAWGIVACGGGFDIPPPADSGLPGSDPNVTPSGDAETTDGGPRVSPIGDSQDAGGDGPTNPAADGGTGTIDGSTDDAGAATPPFVSNLPSTTVVDVGAPATPDIVLLSSNLVQHPNGPEVYQEWLARVRNAGTAVLCLIGADVHFKDSAGAVVANFSTHVRGQPYASHALTIPCLAPGETGNIFTNRIAPSAARVEDITTIAVAFAPVAAAGALPSPSAPTVTSHAQAVDVTRFGVIGTAEGKSVVHDVDIAVFPRDARGLVVAYLHAARPATLNRGESWAFASEGIEAIFTGYDTHVTFLEGALANGRPPAPNGANARLASIAAAQRAEEAAVDARSAGIRGVL
jgi:hypothetical protein